MTTIVVTTSYPAYPGDPSGHFVESEVAQLRAEGQDVRVLAPSAGGIAGGAFGWPGAAARLRENPLRILDVGRFLTDVRRTLEHQNPRQVKAHWALPSGLVAAKARGSWDLEIISHGADVRLLRALPSALRQHLVGTLLGRARVWRFVSEALRAALADSLPGPLERALSAKSEVRPSPLQLEAPLVSVVPPRRQDESRLVWVGRIVPSKNLEAALMHVHSTRIDAHLVVVGDGPERAKLERRAEHLGLRASFVGRVPRPEALAWIASADTLLMSSRAEGLSTVVREAEALGTPVLWV